MSLAKGLPQRGNRLDEVSCPGQGADADTDLKEGASCLVEARKQAERANLKTAATGIGLVRR